MRAALTWGPIGSSEGAQDQAPLGGMGTDAHAFSSVHGWTVEKPLRPFTRFDGHGCPAKCSLWGALLFGYFLLGTQEKVTRSFQDRKLLKLLL
jgi:hypothetical protein